MCDVTNSTIFFNCGFVCLSLSGSVVDTIKFISGVVCG